MPSLYHCSPPEETREVIAESRWLCYSAHGRELNIMISRIIRYLKPEITITEGSQLREGPAQVTGVGQDTHEPLITPFRGKRCLAYVYRVLRMLQTRGGNVPSVVRERVCHVPFVLLLEDGTTLNAMPKKSLPGVSIEEHREMISAGESGVYFDEAVVDLGRKVKVEGMVTGSPGAWQISFANLQDLGPGPTVRQPTRRRRGKKS